jgi:hypothetical protein
MRVSQKPNRTRGRGQRKPSGSNVNRVFESTGPEGKVRGTPQQIIEKYLSLARDAQTSGHRIVAENFLQHAEHYQRLLVEAMDARQERTPPTQQPGHEQQPSHEQPSHEQPSHGQPSHEQPSHGQPSHEQASHGQPGGLVQAEADGERTAAAESGDAQNGGSGQNNRRRRSREPQEPEVSGLTMIDSGQGDSSSLLVDAEDLSASQPQRRPRRRDQEQERSSAPTEAAPEADAQPE